MKICKKCGESNPNETSFCVNCGKDSFDIVEEKSCPHCGASNGTDATHCINCGNPMKAIELPTVVDATEQPEGFGEFEGELTDVEEIAPKETTKCFRCGTEIQINSIFCYKCGAPVSTLHEHRVVERKICNLCDTPNLPQNTYCSFCYASLSEAKTEEFQLVHETVDVGKITVKRAILQGTKGKYKICNNCGALEKTDKDFCSQCGLSLNFIEQKRFCVNCGSENPIDAKFCANCQWSFDTDASDKSEKWTCKRCQTQNSGQNQFCNHCGEKK